MRPVTNSIVAILANLLILAGFASACTATDDLDGTWELLSIDSRPAGDGPAGLPYFTINGHLISGFDGCNQFSGSLGQPLSIASTRMGCAEGAVKFPLNLNDITSHLGLGKIDKAYLEIPALGPFPASVFVRAKK